MAAEKTHVSNLGIALCRGLYGHAWHAQPTSAGVAVKGDVLFLTTVCSRAGCGTTRYERIKLTTGEVLYRVYNHPVAYRLLLQPDEPAPSKRTLRREAGLMLISSRRTRSSARHTTKKEAATA